jgi:hypothetical protein
LHAIAESIRRRDEPGKTFFAALFAVVVANLFAATADWATVRLAGGGFLRDQTTNGVVVLLFTFLWTAASVVLGGYVVARLHDTRSSVSAFIVLELFFGAGLIAEFWSPAASWFDTVVLLFVIPCAILGAALAPPRGLKWMVEPVSHARQSG